MVRISSFVLLSAVLVLPGCGANLRQQLGIDKNIPDEFNVVTRAPLSVPPEFSLRPPTPGAARPQELSSDAMAQQALLGQKVTSGTVPAASGAGGYLLQKAGATGTAGDAIRQVVDQEAVAAREAEKKGGISGIILKSSSQQNQEPVVDAAAESQRVQAAKAAQQAVTGQGAATADPSKDTFWKRNFGIGR
jgi:hypothetical protein